MSTESLGCNYLEWLFLKKEENMEEDSEEQSLDSKLDGECIHQRTHMAVFLIILP